MAALSVDRTHEVLRLPPAASCPAADGDSLKAFAAAAAEACGEDVCLVPFPTGSLCHGGGTLATSLSAAERQRASRFRLDRDRRRYIAAHVRLRQLLGQRLGVRPEEVTLGRNRYGKPELLGPQAASGWHFNLSYSDGADGGLVLYAFSRRGPVGVDVERVRPLNDADGLARHFFSTGEYETYRRLAPAERTQAFFRCWTCKEAFVKALGRGLSEVLADFDVSLAPGQTAQLLRVGAAAGGDCGWCLTGIGPAGGRVAAVVIRRS